MPTTMPREKKPKLTFKERLARYPQYDTSQGYGNADEWRETFAARMGIGAAMKQVGKRNPFEILELTDPLTCSWVDVRAAYRRLARKFHPDLNPGDPTAEENFKDVQAAYEMLEEHPRLKADKEARGM